MRVFLPLLHDTKLIGILVAVAADFVFGVLAAFKLHTFRLSYIGAFLHDDIAGKVLPWAAAYLAARIADPQFLGGTVDLAQVADGFYVVMVAALAGSILSSAKTLGLSPNLNAAGALKVLTAGEHTPTPTADPPVVVPPPTDTPS